MIFAEFGSAGCDASELLARWWAKEDAAPGGTYRRLCENEPGLPFVLLKRRTRKAACDQEELPAFRADEASPKPAVCKDYYMLCGTLSMPRGKHGARPEGRI